MVSSTTAAGTINQTTRGVSSFFTKSASDVAPTAFSLTSSLTASGDRSKTTQLCPFLNQASNHVGSHPAEPYHSKLHEPSFFKRDGSQFFRINPSWLIALRNRCMAAQTPALEAKIDDPATSTFAPAATVN